MKHIPCTKLIISSRRKQHCTTPDSQLHEAYVNLSTLFTKQNLTPHEAWPLLHEADPNLERSNIYQIMKHLLALHEAYLRAWYILTWCNTWAYTMSNPSSTANHYYNNLLLHPLKQHHPPKRSCPSLHKSNKFARKRRTSITTKQRH